MTRSTSRSTRVLETLADAIISAVRTCVCCKREGQLDNNKLCKDCQTCLHCNKAQAVTELGLCKVCNGYPRIKQLYIRTVNWTPEWEQHLRAKAEYYAQEMLKRKVQVNHNVSLRSGKDVA